MICKECHNYHIELSFYQKKKKKNHEKANHLGSNISCLCLRLPNNDLNKIDWCAKVKQTKTNNNTKHIMINTHFPSLQVWRINLSKQNEIKQNQSLGYVNYISSSTNHHFFIHAHTLKKIWNGVYHNDIVISVLIVLIYVF